jgi:hypothetical protein
MTVHPNFWRGLKVALVLAVILWTALLVAIAHAGVVSSFSNHIGSGRYETQDVGLAMFADAVPGAAVPVVVHSVNEPGTMSWSRVSIQSTVKEVLTLNWTPGVANDVYRSFTLHVPVGGSGWEELRWSSNFAHDSTRERTFNTTRHCVHYASGSGNYCGGPTVRGRCGTGSWYETALYNVSFIDCRDLYAILNGTPPATIRVKFQVDYAGGGYGVIARDPDGTQQISGHLPKGTWITVPNPGNAFWLLSVANNGQDGGFQIVTPIAPVPR